MVQEQIDEKLDFHCVSLEKDKNILFPTVGVESGSKCPGIAGKVPTPSVETGDGPEVTVSNSRVTRVSVFLLLSDLCIQCLLVKESSVMYRLYVIVFEVARTHLYPQE